MLDIHLQGPADTCSKAARERCHIACLHSFGPMCNFYGCAATAACCNISCCRRLLLLVLLGDFHGNAMTQRKFQWYVCPLDPPVGAQIWRK